MYKFSSKDINEMKKGINQQNGVFMHRELQFDNSQLDSLVSVLNNSLSPAERARQVEQIGQPLLKGLQKCVSDLAAADDAQKQSQSSGGSPQEAVLDASEEARKLRVMDCLKAIDTSKKHKAALKATQQLIRLLYRLIQEFAESSLLVGFEQSELLANYYTDKLFLGTKIVLQTHHNPHQNLQLGESLLRQVREKLDHERAKVQAGAGKEVLSTLKDNIISPNSEKNEKLTSQTQESGSEEPIEKDSKIESIRKELETIIFVFLLLLENRIIELYLYQAIANIHLHQPNLSLIEMPEHMVIEVSKNMPGNNQGYNNNPAAKLSAESRRYLTMRRTARAMRMHEFIENKEDFLLLQTCNKLNGRNYSNHSPAPKDFSEAAKRLQESFNLNKASKPKNNRPMNNSSHHRGGNNGMYQNGNHHQIRSGHNNFKSQAYTNQLMPPSMLHQNPFGFSSGAPKFGVPQMQLQSSNQIFR